MDPDDNELYWGSLAEMAERASEDTKTVSVWPDTQLTPDGLEQFLDAARLKCLTRRSDPLLNLTSHNPNLISSALFDCLAVGRSDPRYLKLVRSTLTNIPDQRGFLAAVHLLAHATNHPDIFWHRNNIISEETARSIHESYRWSPTEIAMLLARLPEEEECWGRGTIGQSLFHILSVDPSLDWAIDRLMVEAFRVDELTWRSCWVKGPPFGPKWVQTNREIVVIPCFTLSLYLATDAQARLDELTERLPPLTRMSIFPDVASIIEEFGSIDIF